VCAIFKGKVFNLFCGSGSGKYKHFSQFNITELGWLKNPKLGAPFLISLIDRRFNKKLILKKWDLQTFLRTKKVQKKILYSKRKTFKKTFNDINSTIYVVVYPILKKILGFEKYKTSSR
jgi:hypothetical protein